MYLIYCAGSSAKYAAIVVETGLYYGCQLPSDRPYAPVFFADQNWKQPNLERYSVAVQKYRPTMATILDWEHPEQRSQIYAWAEAIAPWVATIVVIPKCYEALSVPASLYNCPVVLGYSVPTRHGGTSIPLPFFAGRDIHLLGGNPMVQRDLWLLNHWNVVSADSSYTQLKSTFAEFLMFDTQKGKWRWQQLQHIGLGGLPDAPYEAFRRSCSVLYEFWYSAAPRAQR